MTLKSIDVSHKVKIFGFVDLIDDAFMISYFDTDEFFLFDLKGCEWFSITPSFGLLSVRCIFAEGFIYTCSDKDPVAFKIIYVDTSCWLGVLIMLDFSWKYICSNRRFLPFDAICKDEIGDFIFFWVHGHDLAPPSRGRSSVGQGARAPLPHASHGGPPSPSSRRRRRKIRGRRKKKRNKASQS